MPTCGPFDEDIDYWTAGSLYDQVDVEQAEACHELCQDVPECGAWTWGKPTNIPGLAKVCFLKLLQHGSSPTKVPKKGVVSGLPCQDEDRRCRPDEEGVDFWTGELVNISTPILGAEQCRQECKATLRCEAWTWGKSDSEVGLANVCFLKGLRNFSAFKKAAKPGVISGMPCGAPRPQPIMEQLPATVADDPWHSFGVDQACRLDEADITEDGKGTAKALGTDSLATCKVTCERAGDCTGVEYSRYHRRCEIWTQPIGHASAGVEGFECLAFSTPSATASTTRTRTSMTRAGTTMSTPAAPTTRPKSPAARPNATAVGVRRPESPAASASTTTEGTRRPVPKLITELSDAAPATTTPAAATPASKCPACAPKSRTIPDIYILVTEDELCKVGLTMKSLAIHDRSQSLGSIYLVWLSEHLPFSYGKEIDEVMEAVRPLRTVHLIDFSGPLKAEVHASPHLPKHIAKEVLMLKIASKVSSEYYLVLDAMNTFVRDIAADTFFTPCNQAKILGDFSYNDVPMPQSRWYAMAANFLKADVHADGGPWPASGMPALLQRDTAKRLLSSIGEGPLGDRLCDGPLCNWLAPPGRRASGTTLYSVFAYSKTDRQCAHAVEDHVGDPQVVLLSRESGPDRNLEACRNVSSGDQDVLVFGAQAGALDGIPSELLPEAKGALARIFEGAGVYDPARTPETALVECAA